MYRETSVTLLTWMVTFPKRIYEDKLFEQQSSKADQNTMEHFGGSHWSDERNSRVILISTALVRLMRWRDRNALPLTAAAGVLIGALLCWVVMQII